ncbi:hypothetical protein GCM10010909_15620 [Acidocella aquatica]|uniref:Uncharacterized protein n=1 Tax=Acidocella aquatica TaxID=1922313 RepID=A0ABQ6A6G8_9PROT|nr:hypothetical protein [Acidocella aquatica]GLR66882.1 hypothetical protein GCM10010909_15620 [Acidocella aquatica]
MTDEKHTLSRRALLGAGIVLPVTFVTGAEADPLVQMAYEDQSSNNQGNAYQQLQDQNGGTGNIPAPPTPDASPVSPQDSSGGSDNSGSTDNTAGTDNSGGTNNTDTSASQEPAQTNPGTAYATPQDTTPAPNEPAWHANSAMQQLQNMNNGENQNSGFDNGSHGDNATTANYAPPVPDTPTAAPLPPVPPTVATNPQYQAATSQYDQASTAAADANSQAAQAQQQWDAIKADPNAPAGQLTDKYQNLQTANSNKVWAQYQAQQALDNVKKTTIAVLDSESPAPAKPANPQQSSGTAP